MTTTVKRLMEIEILGMRCPFCIGAVRRTLEPFEGVEAPEVDLEGGIATFRVAGGAELSNEDLIGAVEEAGFTVGAVRRGVGSGRAA